MPYREASENYYDKKEWHQDTVCTKLMEQKSPGTNVDDTHGRKLESSPGNEEGTSASNLDNDPLADISLSKPCRIDQDSNGTEVSHELTENSKYNSPRYGKDIIFLILCKFYRDICVHTYNATLTSFSIKFNCVLIF